MVGTHAGDMIGEIALAIEMGAGASVWSAKRKALGFFGRVAWQASGSRATRQRQAIQKTGKLTPAAQTVKSG